MERYLRNYTAISREEQKILQKANVIIAGCGGLGGYIIELLGRIGVGHLSVVDNDVFEESNLNRQVLSAGSVIGKFKADVARTRMSDVNPLIEIKALKQSLCENNAGNLIQGHDLVIDALDNIPARLALIHTARESNIPLVHGAIVGWRGRVSVIYPEDTALEVMLNSVDQDYKSPEGNLGITAAYTASRQAAEAVKILIGRGSVCRNKLIEFDLLSGEYDEIPLK